MKKINLLLFCVLLIGSLMAQQSAEKCNVANGSNSAEISPYENNVQISGSDEIWDVLWTFEANSGSQPGIETDGNHFYCPKWNAATITRYEMDGSNPVEFTIEGVENIRDLAYDGNYFYGAAADMDLKVMDFENETLIATISANCTGVTGIRHIAFDPNLDGGNGGFWIGNWAELGAIDKNGNQLVSSWANESCYGSAYDDSDPDNPCLWLFQQTGAEEVTFSQFDINTQSYTGVTHEATDIPGFELGTDAQAGGACTWDDPETGQKLLIGNIQQSPNLIFAYELVGGTAALTYDMALTSLDIPMELDIEDEFQIMGNAKNKGNETITSFDVSYTIDGGTQTVYSVTDVNIINGAIYHFTCDEVLVFYAEGTHEIEVTIGNINGNDDEDPSNNTLTYNIEVIAPTGLWDVVWTFEGPRSGQPGIETDGSNFYCPQWDGDTITRFDMDGGNATDFIISGVSNLRDLAYDGTYFYGAAADMDLKVMDLENEILINSITASCDGVTGIRHIAFDPNLDAGNGGFWIGNWSELGAIDMDGNELIANVGGNESCYGSAYDDSDPENPVLWLFQQVGAEEVTFVEFDINTLTFTGFTHEASDVPGFESGSIAGGACTWDDPVTGYKLLIGNIQQDPNLNFAYVISSGNPEACFYFDELGVGDYVAEQLGGNWTTWGNAPGTGEDAIVSNLFAQSPDNSFLVGSGVDMVYQLNQEPIETGAWTYSHYIYVPTGFSGYFNVQSSPVPGVEWVLEVFFDDGGTGYFENASSDNFTYSMDTWILAEVEFDLDAGLGRVLMDGELITEFENTLTIGGINFWGSDSGGLPGAYFDNVCFAEGSPMGDVCYDFDDLEAGEFLAQQLGGMWTTWSGNPGGDDDSFVSNDQSHSPDNSFVIFENIADVVFKLAEEPIETGAWLYSHYIYIASGATGYFNVQSSPVPGEEWVIELYFNGDGTGYFEGGSTDAFEYAPDTWILVEINFDLDTDLAEVYFDGDKVIDFANEFTIGGINYYGSDTNGDPEAYYDDVCFGDGWPLTVGIQEVSLQNSLKIYPNPATTTITINSESTIEQLEIYNQVGQMVGYFNIHSNPFQLDVSGFESGIYLVKAYLVDKVIIRKVVID